MTSAGQSAFDNLKIIVTGALLLAHFKQSLRIIVKIDFFNYISSGDFSALDKNKKLHSFIFFCKNLNLAESNY